MRALTASCAVLAALSFLSACRDDSVADPSATLESGPSLGVIRGSTGDTLTVGQTRQLSATLKNKGRNQYPTQWTSSDSLVASVSSNGLVTALAPGGTTIKAWNRMDSAVANIFVRSAVVGVAAVAIAPDSVAIAIGDTTRLTATVRDEHGNLLSGRPLAWKVSDTTVATISASGVVHARKTGSALATATSEGVSGTAKVSVSAIQVASVSVTPATASVGAGQTVQLAATARDANGNTLSGRTITWSSATPGIATVSASGLVSGVAPGTVTITATSEGKSAAAQVTVQSATVGTTIYPGDDIQAAVTKYPGGTTFLIKAGTHRLARFVTPKTGNSFIGERGAIVSGARLLTTFVREGGYWVATGQTQENTNRPGECDPSRPRCAYPEDLFFDDKPLVHVSSLAGVTTGKWYFDYAADKIYFADDPTGHKVETSVATAAFYAPGGQHSVTIAGLIIEKFATQAQGMTVGGGGVNDWVIRDNEVRYNHGVGIGLANSQRGKILRNYVHHQGEMGLMGPYAVDLLVEGNEIAYNNTAGYWWSWEGGGAKWTHTRNLVVRGNFSHHNEGIGLWTDYDNDGTIYENNRVEDNADNGIFHEISYSAIIRNNTILRNGFRSPARSSFLGGAGIYIASSPNVEIYGNTILDNAHGIGAEERAGPPSGPLGPLTLTNLNAHDNVIRMSVGYTGVRNRSGRAGVYDASNNRFHNNQYSLGSLARPFYWQEAGRTTSEWRAVGHDVTGTFNP